MDRLKLCSIFKSINGECCERGQGSWTTFVRFFGCNLHCNFCDTKYSWEQEKNSRDITITELIDEIENISNGIKNLTITGGEPLEQPSNLLFLLFKELDELDYEISIETNGIFPIKPYLEQIPNLSFVVDYKLKSSGIDYNKNIINNYIDLSPRQFIKFVIADEDDFKQALDFCKFLKNKTYAKIYFSPCIGKITPQELFIKMKNNEVWKYNINFNLQIHKFIFSEDWRDEEE